LGAFFLAGFRIPARCPNLEMAADRLHRKRNSANVESMDLYDLALKKLKEDPRGYLELEREIGLPWTTLRDIKEGVTKSPRFATVKQIAAYYRTAA
jgi:hypothetical protein